MREALDGHTDALRGPRKLERPIRSVRGQKRSALLYAEFEAAAGLASAFFDPALAEAIAVDAIWNLVNAEWADAR